MFADDEEDRTVYHVVVNHEEQYSIWPEYKKELPLGWNRVGKTALKDECLEFIEQVWTDMRPLSLRLHMEELERKRAAGEIVEETKDDGDWNKGPTLVETLSEGRHSVEISVRPEKSASLFKECIDRGYVHVRFTDTRGGTELGVSLDETACDFSNADFSSATGDLHIEGNLVLDYVKVRCVADIDLSRLEGEGYLVALSSQH